jgi:hypothetical protein
VTRYDEIDSAIIQIECEKNEKESYNEKESNNENETDK